MSSECNVRQKQAFWVAMCNKKMTWDMRCASKEGYPWLRYTTEQVSGADMEVDMWGELDKREQKKEEGGLNLTKVRL